MVLHHHGLLRRLAAARLLVPSSSVVERSALSSRILQSMRMQHGGTISSEPPSSSSSSSSSVGSTDPADRAAAREAIIAEIISFDKEIFELKRQHELSMLRVEQHQKRILKDQEDRGMYYEQNCNTHTFDTISVGLYSQRSTLYHTMSVERLRNFKIVSMILVSVLFCVVLYYRYMINPDWSYIKTPLMWGSHVQTIREEQWSKLKEGDQLNHLRHEAQQRSAHSGASP